MQQAWAIMSVVHILFWLHILTRVINRHAPFEYIVLERRYIYMHIFILQNRHCPVSSTNLNNLTCILEW